MILDIKQFVNIGIGLIKTIEEELELKKRELEELKRKGEEEKTESIQQFEKLLIKLIKDSKKLESVILKKDLAPAEKNPENLEKIRNSGTFTATGKSLKSRKSRAA